MVAKDEKEPEEQAESQNSIWEEQREDAILGHTQPDEPEEEKPTNEG